MAKRGFTGSNNMKDLNKRRVSTLERGENTMENKIHKRKRYYYKGSFSEDH
ncbi:hypothetical protein C1645_817446 [Glomus cerebriforme]|uniref:Uncharacterized protein n=1 Tax=Glomus cerebriforme TaxID=658196 RepID=A0A397TD15_9GLOM|nr:hypothetical protein C1645_817446 [Glomus cerebriforme]